jgi:hypothetical protein
MSARAIPLAALAAVAAALLAVQTATGAGVTITYSVSAGTPGNNGWYLSNVTAQIQASNATNSNCPVVVTFTSSSDSLDCTATDGTSTVSFHLQFKIDKDLPTVTGATADRAPNANGWYNAPVNVTFTGSDATSGIASCTTATYGGPDSAGASVTGTCTDVAGNTSAPSTFSLKYDSTAPTVTAAASRQPDANGWYTHPVTITFSGTDATSGIASCTSSTYGGPDTSGTTVTGTCTDNAGNSASASLPLQYDSTPPTVTAALARPPDAGGWYNHAVTLNASGTDSGSGIASCTGGTYSGPDSASASLTASCVDKAGNSSSKKVTFQYDDTPPKLSDVTVTNGSGRATLHWASSADIATVTINRTPGPNGGEAMVYKGDAHSFTDSRLRNGARYRYVLSVTDKAGNRATAKATATPLALTSPMAGQTVEKPPLLRWRKIAGADYYNVQLFFAGRKVLTAWPEGTSLRLPGSWTLDGRRHTLGKGRYRWYVWPGYGSRKTAKYGKLVGASYFVFA